MKIGHLARAIAYAKAIAFLSGQFGLKIKNALNMWRIILQEHWSCAVQKTTRKNTQCQRNETILKIGHLAFYDILITINIGLLVPKSKMASILNIVYMAHF